MQVRSIRGGGKIILAGIAATCLSFGLAGTARGVTTPYSVDFTTGGQTTDFNSANLTSTPGWSPTWTLTSTPQWENVMPSLGSFGATGITNQTVTAPGAVGNNFVESTVFSLPNGVGSFRSASVGLAALGNNPNIGAT